MVGVLWTCVGVGGSGVGVPVGSGVSVGVGVSVGGDVGAGSRVGVLVEADVAMGRAAGVARVLVGTLVITIGIGIPAQAVSKAAENIIMIESCFTFSTASLPRMSSNSK